MDNWIVAELAGLSAALDQHDAYMAGLSAADLEQLDAGLVSESLDACAVLMDRALGHLNALHDAGVLRVLESLLEAARINHPAAFKEAVGCLDMPKPEGV